MSDRIRVNTNEMMGVVKDLQRLSDKLNSEAASLRRADFTNCGGGGTVSPRQIRLRCSGATISGSRAPTLVKSFASGMDATGSYIDTLAGHVQEALRRFEAVENKIVAISKAEDGGEQEDANLFKYVPKYHSSDEARKAIDAKAREYDSFIDTEYDKAVKKAVRELLMNDEAFSEDAWNSCKTEYERAAFVYNAVMELQKAMGTELKGGVFVSNGDLPMYDGDVQLSFDLGHTVYDMTFPHGAGAFYNKDHDFIFVLISEKTDYEGLMGTLCHENRHNLQNEMRECTDLQNSKYVLNEEEYKQIAEEVQDWRKPYNSLPTEQQILDRAAEIRGEMSGFQKWNYGNEGTIKYSKLSAELEYHAKYYENANEIDARYMERYAEQCVRQKRMLDRIETAKDQLWSGYLTTMKMPFVVLKRLVSGQNIFVPTHQSSSQRSHGGDGHSI